MVNAKKQNKKPKNPSILNTAYNAENTRRKKKYKP